MWVVAGRGGLRDDLATSQTAAGITTLYPPFTQSLKSHPSQVLSMICRVTTVNKMVSVCMLKGYFS